MSIARVGAWFPRDAPLSWRRYRTASGSDRPWVRSRPDCSSLAHSPHVLHKQSGRLRTQAGRYRSRFCNGLTCKIRAGGVDSVTGDLGKLVQARTKGRGHGSTSRAFYARAVFVAHILNLQKLAAMPRVMPGEGRVG